MILTRLISFSFALGAALALPANPQRPGQITIEHSVTISDPASHLFHVTSRYSHVAQPSLTLALPTWSPGWYTIENYAKNILRMRFTDATGRAVPYRMTSKSAWTLDTRGVSDIRVEFDYSATLLALNQAKITPDFAFFTGTELFLEPYGHRAERETVRFRAPPGWRILSALRSSPDSTVFIADNYDQLVDAPTELGNFDVTPFNVDGVPHFLAVTPAGGHTHDQYRAITTEMAKVIHAEAAIFGGQPYDRYVTFYFFLPAETSAGGALEHLNSHVAFAGPRPIEAILPIYAHESFHAWNVKRLRPAGMWPYDYSREDETPLLWVSEGFTNYYGLVARFRAGAKHEWGVMADSTFLKLTADNIARVESNDARNYQPLTDASTSTWLGYDTPQSFSVDYYGGGQAIASLLDVMMLTDTHGARRLDDVMRWLWSNDYKKGKGFTIGDVVAALNAVSGKHYRGFIDRYVAGTAIPPYDSIFAGAGYRMEFSRAGQPVRLGSGGNVTARLVELPSPTAEQLKVRRAWLRKEDQSGFPTRQSRRDR